MVSNPIQQIFIQLKILSFLLVLLSLGVSRDLQNRTGLIETKRKIIHFKLNVGKSDVSQ